MIVSIIIPIFKVENYIERCLQSVLQQDYENIELILVDDCTPDKSMTIAQNVLKDAQFAVKTVTHSQNSGLSVARNSGIRVAMGDYLYFLDSDDELFSKTAISALVQVTKDTKADCVIGNYQQLTEKSNYVSKRYAGKRLFTGQQEIIHAFANGDIPIMAWNKLINKEFTLEHELFFKNGLVNEDELWTFRLILNAKNIALSGEPTYKYYVREGSIMTDKVLERLKSAIEIYQEMVSYALCKMGIDCVWEHLNRFAFKRYLTIMTLPTDNNIRRSLYVKLRSYQKKSKRIFTKKDGVFLFHLFFPASIGFYVMRFETGLYRKLKGMKPWLRRMSCSV